MPSTLRKGKHYPPKTLPSIAQTNQLTFHSENITLHARIDEKGEKKSEAAKLLRETRATAIRRRKFFAIQSFSRRALQGAMQENAQTGRDGNCQSGGCTQRRAEQRNLSRRGSPDPLMEYGGRSALVKTERSTDAFKNCSFSGTQISRRID